jgi:4-amino-4-deoxy-L-arabinose transferase-like glycosyltransferase
MSDPNRPGALVWTLAAAGALLRIAAYGHNRSLTNDEARYAADIVGHSYRQVLEHARESSPPLFKWSTRFAVDLFGSHEYVLRLLPLFFGLIALILFVRLASELLPPRARAMAVLLFAVSDSLIYYSSELKPYSGDVAIALLLLWTATRLDGRPWTWPQALACGLGGAIAVWWSFASVFVLAGLGTAAIAAAWIDGDTKRVWRAGVAAAMWLSSFAAMALTPLFRETSANGGMRGLWLSGFMPIVPRSASDLEWYPAAFIRMFVAPGGFVLPGIAALAFLAGAAILWRQRRTALLMLLSPFPFVLAASALGKYPFSERLLLFVLPACLLLIAAGADWISRQAVFVAVPFTVMLFAPATVMAAYHLKKPVAIEEIKPVLQHVRDHWRPGDRMYVYAGARAAMAYYGDRYGFRPGDLVLGVQARDQWQQSWDDVDRLRGGARVWILFAHVYTWGSANEETVILFHLDQIGRQLDRDAGQDASAYLYDLR